MQAYYGLALGCGVSPESYLVPHSRPLLTGAQSTLRWPRQLTTVVVGQVPNMTRARGRDPGFYRRVRLFARLNALEEILHM